MYSPPADFEQRLRHEFQDRLRIRWSKAKHEYHIEEKVGRAAYPPFRISEIDDRFIRARDGYAFVMAVKAGNHTDCRQCGLRCSVPELKTGEIVCSYCESVKSRRGREFGGYWPLDSGEALIQYLKKLDPLRDGHIKSVMEGDLAQERAEMGRKRSVRNHIEAATYDDKYQIFGTPFVGYTGRTSGPVNINGNPY